MRRFTLFLLGLVPVLAAVACGSASGTTAATDQRQQRQQRPAVAEPGRPVPASAVHRLTAIASRAVKSNGVHPVAWATAVVTTHAKALGSATPGDTSPGAKTVVYLVTIKGHFVCGLCSVPSGAHAPTGAYLSMVINAKNFQGTDFGISRKPPPVAPAQLGPVTHLNLRSPARR